MLVKVLAPGFYAREDMRTPVRIGIVAMVVNMVLNVALVFPLMWWFNLGHVGLAPRRRSRRGPMQGCCTEVCGDATCR